MESNLGIHDINNWLEKMKATIIHHGESCTVIIPRNDVFTAGNQKAAALMATREYGVLEK